MYDLTGGLTGHQQLRLGVYGNRRLASAARSVRFHARTADVGRDATRRAGCRTGRRPRHRGARHSPHARYRAAAVRLRSMAGVVYHAGVVALVPLHASYAGLEVVVRGTLAIGKPLQSDFALHVTGSARPASLSRRNARRRAGAKSTPQPPAPICSFTSRSGRIGARRRTRCGARSR